MLGVESEEAQGILPLNLVPNALASRSVPFKPREPMISPPLNHSLIRCLLVHSTILSAESDLTETPLDQVSFQVADALEQPFEDGIFDLVWSMESGEHMPDKAKVYYLAHHNFYTRFTRQYPSFDVNDVH